VSTTELHRTAFDEVQREAGASWTDWEPSSSLLARGLSSAAIARKFLVTQVRKK
jgi:hypothetical protein